MGAARCPESGGTAEFIVSALEPSDIGEFIGLQDLFAEEHLALTKDVYDKVSLRDWQLSLICPAHILDEPGARHNHVESMIKRDEKCFQSLSILKAVAQLEGKPPKLVGYIMFQVHARAQKNYPKKRTRGWKHRQGQSDLPPTWTQVKQIYVQDAWRRRGCGSRLFQQMLDGLQADEQEEVRLGVVDLNSKAMEWYRSKGFVIFNIMREFIGSREDANVIIYQEMRKVSGGRESDTQKVPSFFKNEVLQEIIQIKYPDGSGVYDVMIVGYEENERFHYVDSAGLSLWEGDTFTDIINLNEYFRDGFINFRRMLSLIHRDVELLRRRTQQAKKDEAKAEEEQKKRERPPELEMNLACGIVTRRAKAHRMDFLKQQLYPYGPRRAG